LHSAVSPEIVAGRDDLLGARPSRPQHLHELATLEFLPTQTSDRNRCGLEGRVPLGLRFHRAALYRRFAVGSAPTWPQFVDFLESRRNATPLRACSSLSGMQFRDTAD